MSDETKLTNGETNLNNDEAKLSDAETKVSTNETKLTNDETKLSKDETMQSNDETKLSNDETKLGNDEAKLIDNETKLSTDELTLSNDETKLSRNETKIGNNETKLIDDKTKLSTDETKVSTLEKEVASLSFALKLMEEKNIRLKKHYKNNIKNLSTKLADFEKLLVTEKEYIVKLLNEKDEKIKFQNHIIQSFSNQKYIAHENINLHISKSTIYNLHDNQNVEAEKLSHQRSYSSSNKDYGMINNDYGMINNDYGMNIDIKEQIKSSRTESSKKYKQKTIQNKHKRNLDKFSDEFVSSTFKLANKQILSRSFEKNFLVYNYSSNLAHSCIKSGIEFLCSQPIKKNDCSSIRNVEIKNILFNKSENNELKYRNEILSNYNNETKNQPICCPIETLQNQKIERSENKINCCKEIDNKLFKLENHITCNNLVNNPNFMQSDQNVGEENVLGLTTKNQQSCKVMNHLDLRNVMENEVIKLDQNIEVHKQPDFFSCINQTINHSDAMIPNHVISNQKQCDFSSVEMLRIQADQNSIIENHANSKNIVSYNLVNHSLMEVLTTDQDSKNHVLTTDIETRVSTTDSEHAFFQSQKLDSNSLIYSIKTEYVMDMHDQEVFETNKLAAEIDAPEFGLCKMNVEPGHMYQPEKSPDEQFDSCNSLESKIKRSDTFLDINHQSSSDINHQSGHFSVLQNQPKVLQKETNLESEIKNQLECIIAIPTSDMTVVLQNQLDYKTEIQLDQSYEMNHQNEKSIVDDLISEVIRDICNSLEYCDSNCIQLQNQEQNSFNITKNLVNEVHKNIDFSCESQLEYTLIIGNHLDQSSEIKSFSHVNTKPDVTSNVLQQPFDCFLSENNFNQQPFNQLHLYQPNLNQSDLYQPNLNQSDLYQPNLNQSDLNQTVFNQLNHNQPELNLQLVSQPDLNHLNIKQLDLNHLNQQDFNQDIKQSDLKQLVLNAQDVNQSNHNQPDDNQLGLNQEDINLSDLNQPNDSQVDFIQPDICQSDQPDINQSYSELVTNPENVDEEFEKSFDHFNDNENDLILVSYSVNEEDQTEILKEPPCNEVLYATDRLSELSEEPPCDELLYATDLLSEILNHLNSIESPIVSLSPLYETSNQNSNLYTSKTKQSIELKNPLDQNFQEKNHQRITDQSKDHQDYQRITDQSKDHQDYQKITDQSKDHQDYQRITDQSKDHQDYQRITDQSKDHQDYQRITDQSKDHQDYQRITDQSKDHQDYQRITDQSKDHQDYQRITDQSKDHQDYQRITDQSKDHQDYQRITDQSKDHQDYQRITDQSKDHQDYQRITDQSKDHQDYQKITDQSKDHQDYQRIKDQSSNIFNHINDKSGIENEIIFDNKIKQPELISEVQKQDLENTAGNHFCENQFNQIDLNHSNHICEIQNQKNFISELNNEQSNSSVIKDSKEVQQSKLIKQTLNESNYKSLDHTIEMQYQLDNSSETLPQQVKTNASEYESNCTCKIEIQPQSYSDFNLLNSSKNLNNQSDLNSEVQNHKFFNLELNNGTQSCNETDKHFHNNDEVNLFILGAKIPQQSNYYSLEVSELNNQSTDLSVLNCDPSEIDPELNHEIQLTEQSSKMLSQSDKELQSKSFFISDSVHETNHCDLLSEILNHLNNSDLNKKQPEI
nr:putative leucine-rich repeat-containing protein DDB_G0290503 isoform X2 [Hydra vulgaris]